MEDDKSKQNEIVASEEKTAVATEPTNISAASNDDPELDDLLDSALEDFDKATAVQAVSEPLTDDGALEEESGASGGAAPAAGPFPAFTQDGAFNEIFNEESQKQLEDMMKAMMGDSPDLMQNFTKLASAAAQSDDTEDGNKQFERTLQDTVNSMAENTQQLQNEPSEEELMKMFQGMGLGPGDLGAEGAEGGAGDMGSFMPMMQTMMRSILSKDVLYPSLHDISSKYPKYLEENKDKLSSKDYQDYSKQYEIMTQICNEFESEKDTDSDAIKDKRMETVMDLMERMRAHGIPPQELVGEMPPGFDPNIFGGMPTTPEQCSVM